MRKKIVATGGADLCETAFLTNKCWHSKAPEVIIENVAITKNNNNKNETLTIFEFFIFSALLLGVKNSLDDGIKTRHKRRTNRDFFFCLSFCYEIQ